jgi:hypothetical protein
VKRPQGTWSVIGVSFLADFLKTDREIGHEEEAVSFERIVAVLNQAEFGLPVADLIRQTGISGQFYRGKKRYAGLESTQALNSNSSPRRICDERSCWRT